MQKSDEYDDEWVSPSPSDLRFTIPISVRLLELDHSDGISPSHPVNADRYE